MRDQYMRFGHGFLLVYSITDRHSFDEIRRLREQIYRVQDKDENCKIPMVLVGNKCDMEEYREVSSMEGKELAKSWDIQFIETSAMTRQNIDEAFHLLVRSIRKLSTPKDMKKEDKKKKKMIKIAKALNLEEKCSIL